MNIETNYNDSWIKRANTSKHSLFIKVFSSKILLERVKGTWMFDEEILLLIKEEKHREAIYKYVDA